MWLKSEGVEHFTGWFHVERPTYTILSVTHPHKIYYVIEYINITSMHTISGSFISYNGDPLGEWIHSNIQSTLLFRHREGVPPGYFTCTNFEKNVISMFITIQYLRHLCLISP